jgi:hypothetical protein
LVPVIRDGVTWIRLLGAGAFLSIIVRFGGLGSAIVIHFWVNDSLRTGRFGRAVPPGALASGAFALLALIGVRLALAIESRHADDGAET